MSEVRKYELVEIKGDFKANAGNVDQSEVKYQDGDYTILGTFDKEEDGIKALQEHIGFIDLVRKIDVEKHIYNGTVYELQEFIPGKIDEGGDEDVDSREYYGSSFAICPDEVLLSMEDENYYLKEEVDKLFEDYARRFFYYDEEKLKAVISEFCGRKFTEFECDGKLYYTRELSDIAIENLKDDIRSI